MHRILIIDDSDLIRAYVKVGLKKFGYDVTVMENASAALKVLQEEKELPGLVFVDVNMPNMNGYVFTRMLKNSIKFKLIPVVFITSNNSQWDKDHAKACGASEFIVKPFTVEALLVIVKKYIF